MDTPILYDINLKWPFIDYDSFFFNHSLDWFFGSKTKQDSLSTNMISYPIRKCRICHQTFKWLCVIFESSFQFQKSNLIIYFQRARLATVCLFLSKNNLRLKRSKKMVTQTLNRRLTTGHAKNLNIILPIQIKKEKKKNAIVCGKSTTTTRKWLFYDVQKKVTSRQVGICECVITLNFNEIICDSWKKKRDNCVLRKFLHQ